MISQIQEFFDLALVYATAIRNEPLLQNHNHNKASQTYCPRNGIREEKMSKELGHVPEFVCFKAMDSFVLTRKTKKKM